MAPWIALHTHPRAEKVVRQYLEGKDVEVFLPTVTRWSRWKDRKKAIEWPLFPGYCFVRSAPERDLEILRCPRVSSIVSFGGQRIPVSEDEIHSLRTLIDSELAFDPAPFIKEGAMVKVVSGPMRGAIGRLVRKRAHARLVLSVDLLAQSVSVQVDAADVRPY